MNRTEKKNFDCETCTLSKQTNVRNRDPDVIAEEPFQLVHTDLAGPIDPIAKDGFRYAIIFTVIILDACLPILLKKNQML